MLVFPALQQHAKLFDFKPLNGVTLVTQRPNLTVKSFMDGSYQQQEEHFLAENIGFREVLVRCYNQLTWSLFRKTQNKTIFVNEDNWLFNDFAIKHHYGQSVYDYVKTNEEAIKKMNGDAVMLYLLQNTLKEYGVNFFVCLAPSKDMVCSEHVPEVKGFNRSAGIRAIDYYPSLFDSLGINYIDFSKYFMEIKDTVSYPLYLKSSSHWSNQAAVYMADTLFRYMEALGVGNMHNLVFGEQYLDQTHFQDDDLEKVMNLMWPIESGKNYYTHFKVDDDTTAIKPRLLSVGDSYYWGFRYNLPLDALFETHHYWYYNKTVQDDPIHSNLEEVDILRELLSSHVVMLIYSPCNLFDLNRQFLTNALFNLYFEDGVIDRKIERIKQDIRNTPDWYASIEQKALANGQDLDEVLTFNAKYVLYGTPGNYFDEFTKAMVPTCRNSFVAKVVSEVNNAERQKYRQEINNDKKWLESIREKAKTSHITLDAAIERDIDWILRVKEQQK